MKSQNPQEGEYETYTMGIRGLCSWIQWAAPQSIQEPNWTDWRGKTIGVDMLGLLYNAKSRKQCPFQYIGKLVARCKQYGIRIVPIFDGKPPIEKSETLKQRFHVREESTAKLAILEKDYEHTEMSELQREWLAKNIQMLEKKGSYVTSEEREIAKQIFYACGIVPLNATGEADNVLAYFAKRGELDAILSNDFDLLARGVETLLVPEFYALPGDRSGWSQYSLSRILQHAQFQYEQFVEMCVLMGSDYTSKNLPYKSAYWTIKFGGSFSKALCKLAIEDETPYHKAIAILRGEGETMDTLMGEKQWGKWRNVQPQPEPETLSMLRTTVFQQLLEEEYRTLYCAS